jgi:hypothetical protein
LQGAFLVGSAVRDLGRCRAAHVFAEALEELARDLARRAVHEPRADLRELAAHLRVRRV